MAKENIQVVGTEQVQQQSQSQVKEVKPVNKELYTALAKAFNELELPKKTADNPFHKSKYVPLENVIASVKKAFGKHGLFVSQPVKVEYQNVEVMNQQGMKYFNRVAVVKVSTVVCHENGDTLEYPEFILESESLKAQAIGSAITYARRYSLTSALGLAGEEDDDGNMINDFYDQPQQQIPLVTPEQVQVLQGMVSRLATLRNVKVYDVVKHFGVNSLDQLYLANFEPVQQKLNNWLSTAEKEMQQAQQPSVQQQPSMEGPSIEHPSMEEPPMEQSAPVEQEQMTFETTEPTEFQSDLQAYEVMECEFALTPTNKPYVRGSFVNKATGQKVTAVVRDETVINSLKGVTKGSQVQLKIVNEGILNTIVAVGEQVAS